jgi:hypothetical protein
VRLDESFQNGRDAEKGRHNRRYRGNARDRWDGPIPTMGIGDPP